MWDIIHTLNHEIYLWIYCLLLDIGRFFSFFILYTVGRTHWTRDQPVAKPLPAHRINAHRHSCFSGIRTHDPAFKRGKTVYALDRSATVISSKEITFYFKRGGGQFSVGTISFRRAPGTRIGGLQSEKRWNQQVLKRGTGFRAFHGLQEMYIADLLVRPLVTPFRTRGRRIPITFSK
jgi:hypothetical protein